MKKSILLRLRVRMLLFGILMGIVFPFYANFFVTFKEGLLIYFVAGCIMAGITVGIVSHWFVKQILLSKMREVADVSLAVKNKSIAKTIEIDSDDLVGEIVAGINSAIVEIRGIIIDIRNVLQSSEKLDIYDNSSRNSSINIANSIQTVTQATGDLTRLVEDTAMKVKTGRKTMESSASHMHHASGLIQELVQTTDQLISQSSQIQSVTKVLADIAVQTNLLALNATIEASKAGEAGRSFTVVAGEIRRMSMTSSEASKAIKSQTNEIFSAIEGVGILANQIHVQIQENLHDSQEIGHSFNEITLATDHFKSSNHELVHSVETLNVSFVNMKETVDDLSEKMRALKSTIANYQA